MITIATEYFQYLAERLIPYSIAHQYADFVQGQRREGVRFSAACKFMEGFLRTNFGDTPASRNRRTDQTLQLRFP